MQLTFEGKTIDQVSIELIQAYSNPDEPYYGGFSGGKDSVVIYDLAKRAEVPIDWHYCVSPIDPPQIYKFIKEYYPDVQWDFHARGFWKLVVKKGLPMRQSRWCCEVIKEAGGKGRVKILGMRSAESNTRSKYKCFDTHGNKGDWLLPILNWSDSDVWQYIAERNLNVCPLYKEGFTRIGCILCPFSRNIKREEYYFPKVTNLWKLACEKIVQQRIANGQKTNAGKPVKHEFWSGEELYQWWTSRS